MLFGATNSDVEKAVASFFKNARDRSGGRLERRMKEEEQKKGKRVNFEIDIDESDE